MQPLTIFTNQKFDAGIAQLLEESVRPHKVVRSASMSASNLVAGARDPAALDADVIYGQPDLQDIADSKRLKWIQLTSAGYTRYDKPEVLDLLREKNIAFCNASSVYDEPCAQHVMAMLLSMARAIPQATLEQQRQHWNYLPLRAQSFLLQGQKMAIVGYGAIARRLVELLSPYRLDVVAFRRKVRGDENVKTLPIEQVDAHLEDSQIVINILPASSSTKDFFDAARFARIKPGAIYINIGRGDTNDQNALADALEAGLLSNAFIDVSAPEPLPADHRLWRLSNCQITPHIAGGTFDEGRRMVDHFVANLRRFERGEELVDRVV